MALDNAIEAHVETRVPVVPPALPVLAKPKNPLSFLLAVFKNNLSAFTETSFKTLFDRARVLGREVVLVNDPVAARHVFGAGAASYRRPVASLRIIRSVAGAGVLTAEGADWRRQRRTLAPSFTPAAIERLIPHFKAAAEDLVERLTGRGEVGSGRRVPRHSAGRSPTRVVLHDRHCRASEPPLSLSIATSLDPASRVCSTPSHLPKRLLVGTRPRVSGSAGTGRPRSTP